MIQIMIQIIIRFELLQLTLWASTWATRIMYLYYNLVMGSQEIVNELAKINTKPKFDENLLTAINLGIAEGFCRNDDIEDGMALYEQITLASSKNIISPEFIEKIRNLAEHLFIDKKYTNALIQYKRILNLTELSAKECLNTAICLIELGQIEAGIEFLKKYEELAPDKIAAYGTVAEILGLKLKMYPEAISYLEKYIQINQKNALAYNTLGHFYSAYYNDEFLEKQLNCFLNANKLLPNDPMYIRNIIFVYEKIGDVKNTDKFYKKLLKLNPTHLDYYYYGCFLLQQGNFIEGYKYFEHRFFATESAFEYPKWLDTEKRLKSCDNLSDKTVLIFHDSGYGDTIMYVRFIEQLKQKVKKIIFFVPDKLIGLFEASGIDVEMHSMTDDLTELDYDYNAALMDLPMLLATTKDSIPKTEGYLKIPQPKVEAYKKEHLENTGKIKIGISYCSNPKYKNQTNRDIPLEAFYPLAKLNNIEVYSLQVLDPTEQIKNLPPDIKITNLSPTFKDFEDTAAAMLNMDLIITTDNVILNLAGALGVKTYGLYNKFHDYRWFKMNGKDVGWYKSIKPYQAETFNGWDDLMVRIVNDLANFL